MKKSLIGAVIAVTASLLGNQYAIAAPPSYPLHCVGGPGMPIEIHNNRVSINFQPAHGAAHNGLQPGMCTWSDRAFRPGEPTRICDNSHRAANYVGRLMRNQLVILDVYNNRQGCMQVTRVGP